MLKFNLRFRVMETSSRPAGLAVGLARLALGRHQAPIRPVSDQWVPHFPASVQGIRPAPTVAAGRYPRAVADAEATTRARRVAALAEAALGQVEATRRAVEQLLAEV